MAEIIPVKMIPVKLAYKIHRYNSKEIYKGFSFKHLSDATQYYVHPDNQSYSGTTTLAQPIGEAIILFSDLLSSIRRGDPIGDFYGSDLSEDVYSENPNAGKTYFEINIPEDYRSAGVFDKNVFQIRALRAGADIQIAAYDKTGRLIPDHVDPKKVKYDQITPEILLLAVKEYIQNPLWAARLEKFSENPACDDFVNLHEDFYQDYKADEFRLGFGNISPDSKDGLVSFGERYATVCRNKVQLNKTKKIDLVKFDESEFSSDRLSLVPELSEELVLPSELVNLCSAVSMGDAKAVLLHGPAGTGKTVACKLMCEKIGLPLMETINCTENLDEFVLGKYVPDGDKISFFESYVTKAIRDGGAVVFEEINFAKPQYLSFLNSLLDDNGFVRLDNGKVVKRHKNFRFFATMNIGYFGTRELNQALYNRFSAVVEISALSDEAVIRMLSARVPECGEHIPKMLGVYRKIKAKIDSEEAEYVISPRNLENWARLAKYEGYLKAAEKTIIPAVRGDRALEEAIRGIIMLYRWD